MLLRQTLDGHCHQLDASADGRAVLGVCKVDVPALLHAGGRGFQHPGSKVDVPPDGRNALDGLEEGHRVAGLLAQGASVDGAPATLQQCISIYQEAIPYYSWKQSMT